MPSFFVFFVVFVVFFVQASTAYADPVELALCPSASALPFAAVPGAGASVALAVKVR